MRMSPATRMMVMSDRYGKSGGNEDRTGGSMRSPRTSTAQGHTYDRTQDRARDEPTRYGRERNASRGYGYDPDVDVNERGQHGKLGRDDDDDWDFKRRKPQRMYAAGVAWTDAEVAKGKDHKQVDEATAMAWVRDMHAVDGTQMPKWQPEQTEALRKTHCPDCDKWEWYVALHMMYADYAEVAKKLGVNKEEFYAGMAKAFLMDEDAGPGKLSKYMNIIPKD